jgi:hypothetical protein
MQKVMSTSNPADQKRIRVAGYSERDWNKVSTEVMKEGIYAKFTQNDQLKEFLLKTNGKTLCEASPNDKIWGIGKSLYDKDLMNKKSWGQNRLGKVLMEVRSELL